MKREIKFRAWDVVDKRMILPDIWMSRLCGEGVSLEEILGNEEYAVMQFTGLKDKNGKEIYEGDIVEFKEKHYDKPYSFVVSWDDISASFVCNDFKERYYRWLSSMTIDTHFSIKYEYKKIVGNIYENPELLK